MTYFCSYYFHCRHPLHIWTFLKEKMQRCASSFWKKCPKLQLRWGWTLPLSWMHCSLPGRFSSSFQWVNFNLLSFGELINKFADFFFHVFVGNIDIPCLREAAETKTNDEDAWAEGCTLLADILRLFLGPFSSLHDDFHHLWVHYRYQLTPCYWISWIHSEQICGQIMQRTPLVLQGWLYSD